MTIFLRLFQALIGFLWLTLGMTSSIAHASEQDDLNTLAQEIEQEFHIPIAKSLSLLKQARYNQEVIDAISKPWEAKPWYQYYPIFLTEKRLAAGLRFWRTHEATLKRAEQEFGVPAEIIVAIIGVETFYGQYLGKYPVLDSLYTLGLHYPARAKFFRSELKHFIQLLHDEKLNHKDLLGSYAGAMGYGQFISSSYRAYAVDFDGDGRRDLYHSIEDAIGSVANYFARHHWKQGEAIALPAWIPNEFDKQAWVSSRGTQLTHTLKQLKEAQIAFTHFGVDSAKARLFEFEEQQGHSYWVGLHNFYVITRYNQSPLYAMAVFQFSEQLRTAMQATQ